MERGRGAALGPAAAAAVGQPISLIIPERFRSAHAEGLARVSGGEPSRLEGRAVQLAGLRGDGSEFPVELSLSAWQRGGQPYYTAIVRDVSEREALHAAMLAQATTDPLTGRPNRSGLTEKLQGLLADPGALPISVICLDLDGFTEVNASVGPAGGDRVLARVGGLLAGCLRPGQLLARVGSDEFAVLLPQTGSPQAQAMARRLCAALTDSAAEPGAKGGVPVQLGACAGVATHRALPADGNGRRSAATVLRDANLALADAKAVGPGTVRAYRPRLVTSARRRRALHTALQPAIGHGELTLAYQPQIELATGRVRAVEALARWNHPTLGPIGPDEFIPLAESTGLMPALGSWALDTACATAAGWQAAGLPPVGVSVNVSARQLASDDIIATVEHALAASGLTASTLTLEITESVLITDPRRTARRLTVLKDLGLRIAVDDFGTGYSSLTSLTNFPVDELKIDQAFIAPLPDGDRALRIATAVTAMAHGLGLTTVAEGIETIAQADLLRELDVTLGQGHLYARPRPAEQIPALLTPPPSLRLLPTEDVLRHTRPA